MRLKNIHLSFLILSSLVILSFAFYVGAENNPQGTKNIFIDSDQDGLSDEEEKTYGTNPQKSDTDGDGYSDGAEVKSGYDPLKPAPGDKIVTKTTADTGTVAGDSHVKTSSSSASDDIDLSVDDKNNITQQVARKIADVANNPDQAKQELSVEELQSMINDTMSNSNVLSDDMLPEINKENIKIKKQDYSKLSDEKSKEKKKEDFINYIVAIYYIISSNSPEALTSGKDISNLFQTIPSKLISTITTRDTSAISDFSASGEKMIEQIKEVEVPQDLVNLHIKALRFAYYTKSIKNNLAPKKDDPLGDIAQLSKIQALLESIGSFAAEAGTKFSEYGVSYDDAMKQKIKSYGLPTPEEGDLTSSSSSSL